MDWVEPIYLTTASVLVLGRDVRFFLAVGGRVRVQVLRHWLFVVK